MLFSLLCLSLWSDLNWFLAQSEAGVQSLNFFFFLLFRVAHVAYGGSQARDQIGAVAAPQPQQRRIQATSVTYTTAHSDAGSLTYWARPGIEPVSSWMLVRLVNCWATTGTLRVFIFNINMQLPQHYLLKESYYPHVIVLVPLWKATWLYIYPSISELYCLPLTHLFII